MKQIAWNKKISLASHSIATTEDLDRRGSSKDGVSRSYTADNIEDLEGKVYSAEDKKIEERSVEEEREEEKEEVKLKERVNGDLIEEEEKCGKVRPSDFWIDAKAPSAHGENGSECREGSGMGMPFPIPVVSDIYEEKVEESHTDDKSEGLQLNYIQKKLKKTTDQHRMQLLQRLAYKGIFGEKPKSHQTGSLLVFILLMESCFSYYF